MVTPTTVYITPQQRKRLFQRARLRKTSFSDELRTALDLYLDLLPISTRRHSPPWCRKRMLPWIAASRSWTRRLLSWRSSTRPKHEPGSALTLAGRKLSPSRTGSCALPMT